MNKTGTNGGFQRQLEQALDRALEQSDDAGVWHFLETYGAEYQAQDALAQQLGKCNFQHGARTVYTQIQLMPVLVKPPVDLINVVDWPQVNTTVDEALQRWYPRSTGLVLFPGVTPYAWVASWRPQVWRAHLRRMQPQYRDANARVAFSARTFPVPPEVPQLGFITIGCSTHIPRPEVVDDAHKTARLEDVVRSVLPLAGCSSAMPGHDACWVCAPLPPHKAITTGLVQWLKGLQATVGIAGYSVNPSSCDRDAVEITLQLANTRMERTAFVLRQHQIGLRGLAAVLDCLHQLAPAIVVHGWIH
jgi:hypothetical protein